MHVHWNISDISDIRQLWQPMPEAGTPIGNVARRLSVPLGSPHSDTFLMAANNFRPGFDGIRPAINHNVEIGAAFDAGKTLERDTETRLKLAQLYERYSPLVFATAFKTTGDRCNAEDVVQDIFLRLCQEPSRFNPRLGNVAAWLTVAARHRSIDYLRKARGDAYEGDWGKLTQEFVQVDNAEIIERIERVKRVMLTLPARQRNALMLGFVSGLAHSEISRRMGEPLGTVKSLIRTGLAQLRETFRRDR